MAAQNIIPKKVYSDADKDVDVCLLCPNSVSTKLYTYIEF